MTIDLRSDTVTAPSAAMREAIACAVVGDDFYGDDPTVQTLERRLAEITGKEAALFVPSGTMGNLIAHLVHCPAGGEVVGPAPAHTFYAETGGPFRLAGVTPRVIPQVRAELAIELYRAQMSGETILRDATRLMWVEQPTRGFVVSLDDLADLRRLADDADVPVHMDGARLFNAATALDVPAEAIARHADTVLVCLSKSLGAPIGSLLVGPAPFIASARRARQQLGGGLRQAGIVAAAGLYALEHNVTRLRDDHASAARLAALLAEIPGVTIDRDVVQTNMFFIDLADVVDVGRFVDALAANGVLVNRPTSGRRLRYVLHLGVAADDLAAVVEATAEAVNEAS